MTRAAYLGVCLALLLGGSIAAPAPAQPASTVPAPHPPPLIFMTDFGLRDDAVAICKGVMHSIEPGLRIVDLTHDVTAFDVREGAFYLAQTAPYYPKGAVFVGVVDPGVGTGRRAIVLATERGQLFVGPDNGLLSLVAADQGVAGIWEVANPDVMLPHPSATFHGRDVFSPCGAHLAAGLPPAEVGPPLDEMVVLHIEAAHRDGDRILGEVMLLDKSFGNVWTNVSLDLVTALSTDPRRTLQVRFEMAAEEDAPADTAGALTGTSAGTSAGAPADATTWSPPVEVPLVATFGDVPTGAALAYFNSRDQLSFAVNMGDFATAHGIVPGLRVEIRAGSRN